MADRMHANRPAKAVGEAADVVGEEAVGAGAAPSRAQLQQIDAWRPSRRSSTKRALQPAGEEVEEARRAES